MPATAPDEDPFAADDFIKDPDKDVQTLLKEKIAELGENISIRRFSRFQVGEGLEHEEKNLAEEVQQQIASA